jgi:AraC-like DNA-binding protein
MSIKNQAKKLRNMLFVNYHLRLLLHFYKQHYGVIDLPSIILRMEVQFKNSESWFFYDTQAAIEFINALNKVGYFTEYEASDFFFLSTDLSQAECAVIPPLARAIQAELRNSDSIQTFCNTVIKRFRSVGSLLRIWVDQQDSYWKIYYDFLPHQLLHLSPVYPLIILCTELRSIFNLHDRDITVYLREGYFQGIESLRMVLPHTVAMTKSYAYIQINQLSSELKPRYHNPNLTCICRSMVETMLCDLDVGDSFAHDVMRSVHRHLNQKRSLLSVEDLASTFHMSQATFYRRLQEAGMSYSSICNAVRLAGAQKFLRKEGYSILDIANLLGFSDTASFSRFFKQQLGITPSLYRAQKRNGSSPRTVML